MFFPPLLIVGIDALSIEIEYIQEHFKFVREMIGRQVRRLLRVLTGALTYGKLVGTS
jgi:hypothetical protein